MAVLGCLRLFRLPTPEEITHLVSLNKAPPGVGRGLYYVKSRKKSMIEGITSSLKDWKTKWF